MKDNWLFSLRIQKVKNRDVRLDICNKIPRFSKPSYDVCIFHEQVILQQTSTWVSAKFSSMMKLLAEKQEVTELYIEEQQEATISEAESRLAELQEHNKLLQDSQKLIEAVHNLSDTELIKVGTTFWLERQ